MKHFFKWLLPIVCCATALPLFAQDQQEDGEFNDRDDIEARPFLRYQQEKIELEAPEEKAVVIGGDVRLKWVPQAKNTYGFHTRGSGAVNPVTIPEALIPTVAGSPLGPEAAINRAQVQAHLQADYEQKESWAQVRLEFGDTIGIESTHLKTILEVAWAGYQIYECKGTEFFVEMGRQPLRNILTSRIQSNGVFNGILLTYETPFSWADFYLLGGPSVVSFANNHYAWFAETALEDIAGTGFYTIYSFSHWKHSNSDVDALRYRYINSQLILGYHLYPELIGYDSKIHAGVLLNHAAEAIPVSANQKRNFAWYVGFQIGQMKKKGDWLFDICYQDVGYQTIPDFDYAGIGRGNTTSRGDLPAVVTPNNPSAFVPGTNLENLNPAIAEGNNNFRGVQARYYYNITNEFTLKVAGDYSVAKDQVIGGPNTNKIGEISMIYSF